MSLSRKCRLGRARRPSQTIMQDLRPGERTQTKLNVLAQQHSNTPYDNLENVRLPSKLVEAEL
eukprot:6180224-Pleurochrysis_carterae.AAC.2